MVRPVLEKASGQTLASKPPQRTSFCAPETGGVKHFFGATPGKVNGSCPNRYTRTSIAWGTAFYDSNNDGWEDLYMSGGNTNRSGNMLFPKAYFQNNQDGTFLDLTLQSGLNNTISEKMPTALCADFNNDGFIDIFQWGLTGSPQLFLNRKPWRAADLAGSAVQSPEASNVPRARQSRKANVVGERPVKHLRRAQRAIESNQPISSRGVG